MAAPLVMPVVDWGVHLMGRTVQGAMMDMRALGSGLLASSHAGLEVSDGSGHRVESDIGVPELVDEAYDQADVGVGVGDLGPAFGEIVDELVDGAGGALPDEGSFYGPEAGVHGLGPADSFLSMERASSMRLRRLSRLRPEAHLQGHVDSAEGGAELYGGDVAVEGLVDDGGALSMSPWISAWARSGHSVRTRLSSARKSSSSIHL